MATIIDVAKKANVSTMTVSRIINGTHRGSEETRAIVNRAIKELGYIPNNAARSLVTKSNKSLAMLVPSIANPYYGRVLLGIESEAEKYGYSVLLMNANRQNKYNDIIENIISRGVDGVIAILLNFKEEHIEKLKKRDIEIVLIDNESEITKTNTITTDNVFGAKLAVDYLAKLGHKSIAHIHGNLLPSDQPISIDDEDTFRVNFFKQRLEGFQMSMLENKLDIDEKHIVGANSRFGEDIESGSEAMVKLLSLKYPPTAVYATNDGIALGAATAMVKHGVRIGEDISIISHGGVFPSNIIYPSLTQVIQPRFRLGKLAAEKIISSLQVNAKYKNDIVKPELLIGESTKKCTN